MYPSAKRNDGTDSNRLNWLFFLIILVGVTFQVRQYLANRSLWLDEAMLANNVVIHSLRFLWTQPLESEQAAPAGFLLGLKLVGKVLGYRDQILRLIPHLFGIAILPIAYQLRKRFKHPLAQLSFVALLALSPVLIYYSNELKQYILDIFFTIFLLWIGLNYRNWRYGTLFLLVSGLWAILFCNPSIFILAAIGITQSIIAVRRRNWKAFSRLLPIGVAWGLLFSLVYWFSLRGTLGNSFLKTYWQDGFAVPPFPLANLKWYLDSSLGLTHLGFSASEAVFAGIIPAWYSPTNWIILGCILIGGYGLLRHDREWLAVNLLAILLTCLASGLHLYPFRSRPVLFLIPVLYSFLSAFVELLSLSPVRAVKAGAGAGTALFLCLLLFPAAQQFLHPVDTSDIKGALSYIELHHEAGDQVAFSAWSTPAYQFYRPVFPLEAMSIIDAIPVKNDADRFVKDLCLHGQLGRTWIVFSHRFSERIGFLSQLPKEARLIDQWESVGSGAYLFDFSDPALCRDSQGN